MAIICIKWYHSGSQPWHESSVAAAARKRYSDARLHGGGMAEFNRHRANRLIAAIPARQLAQLAPNLEIVPLTPRTVLVESGARLQHAYFPHGGVICLMAAMRKGGAETATVGPEGFIGFEALLGSRIASQRVLVQVEGTASRLPIQTLADAAQESASLRGLLLGYVRYFLIQVLQSVACNGLHSVQERFARWLLMAHDRAGTDSFRLTQEFLADLLGIHRPSVTIVARTLQAAGLISYSRGLITITDRKGLEEATCECYEMVRHALQQTPSRLVPARR
jgi:CRP-like cAMP-binding protein